MSYNRNVSVSRGRNESILGEILHCSWQNQGMPYGCCQAFSTEPTF